MTSLMAALLVTLPPSLTLSHPKTSAWLTLTQPTWTPSWRKRYYQAAWTTPSQWKPPTTFLEATSIQLPLASLRNLATTLCLIWHHSKEDHFGLSTNGGINASSGATKFYSVAHAADFVSTPLSIPYPYLHNI